MMINQEFLKTHLYFFFILISLILIRSENACTTPDGWNGNCVLLQQCRSLYSIFTAPLTTQTRNFLRNSQCGRDGSNIFVCCPNTFTINDLPTNEYCGTIADRIYGGVKTSIYEFPWYAIDLSINICANLLSLI